jgi:hypothetical protein
VLDPNLAALLTEDVVWKPKTGVDGDGQDVWGDPVTLKCYPSYGAVQIQRSGGVVYTSTMSLSFDGDDERVKQFKLGDLFTSPGIAGGQRQEAKDISAVHSPGPSFGEPMSTWLVEVFL